MSWNRSFVDGPLAIPLTKTTSIVDGKPVVTVTNFAAEYHVNGPRWLMDLVPELKDYAVIPASPDRVFAGESAANPITAWWAFEDEAEAKRVLARFWINDGIAVPDPLAGKTKGAVRIDLTTKLRKDKLDERAFKKVAGAGK